MRNPYCQRCDLAATCKTICLWGKGPKRADLMLVGEAPGAQEDNAGKPFVGESGQILDECLRNAGIDPDSVYITNAVKCRPPNNADPTPAQLGACVRYLVDEIQTVQPKVIVCVGRWALKALTGETAINRARGRILAPLPKLRLGDVKLIATTHPAAYLHQGRNQAVLAGIVEDLRYVENLIHSEKPKSLRYVLPTWTLPELRTALAHLMGASKIACDLEWTAIPNRGVPWPWTPGTGLLSMSLTGRVSNALVTVAFSWPTTKPDDRLLDWLDSLDLIFHNAMADVIWMLSQGLRPRVKGDSMLLSYLLDEHKRAALKGLGPLVTGVKEGWAIKPWTRRPTTRKGWLELLNYNADDTEMTLLLHEGLVEQLLALEPTRRDNIARLYQKLILPAVVPFARTALNGTPIDEKALRKEIAIHQQKRQEALEELAQITGLRVDVAERLAGSPAKVVRYAREAYGLEIETSRADDLSDFIGSYPALAAIQAFKHERKMLSTYLEPWQRLINSQGDGRLHSIYLLGATRTGRLSAELEEGGSLLLTPRDDWMRNLIAAVDDDWEIQAADYSQIELRVIAWLAPERRMRQLFKEGADLHATTAAYVKARVPLKKFWANRPAYVAQVTKDERQAGKSNNFGFVFGMQAEHYQSYAKSNYGVVMTVAQAEKSREGFFRLYSDLQAWHDRATREDYRRGYTVTPFGRYRFDLPDPTKAINTPIQATATDLTIFAYTLIDEMIQKHCPDDAIIVGFVHDAVLLQVRKSRSAFVKKIIKRCMETPSLERVGVETIPVPLVADIKIGKTWAQAQ